MHASADLTETLRLRTFKQAFFYPDANADYLPLLPEQRKIGLYLDELDAPLDPCDEPVDLPDNLLDPCARRRPLADIYEGKWPTRVKRSGPQPVTERIARGLVERLASRRRPPAPLPRPWKARQRRLSKLLRSSWVIRGRRI